MVFVSWKWRGICLFPSLTPCWSQPHHTWMKRKATACHVCIAWSEVHTPIMYIHMIHIRFYIICTYIFVYIYTDLHMYIYIYSCIYPHYATIFPASTHPRFHRLSHHTVPWPSPCHRVTRGWHCQILPAFVGVFSSISNVRIWLINDGWWMIHDDYIMLINDDWWLMINDD